MAWLKPLETRRVVGALVVGSVLAMAARGDDLERIEFFEKRIRPVLAKYCYECHGPQKAESDLRLDHISFLTKQGVYGIALVPGKPHESMLYVSLTHVRPDLQMPFEREQLDPAILADFKVWIEQGAAWPDESPEGGVSEGFDRVARQQRLPWIWQTPSRQAVPSVRNASWPMSDVDAFILSRLETEGIEPVGDAPPETWLRRVHLALTGLPPTTAELQDWLRDPQWHRREAIVDKLLQSPHFGERWARHWMDLVRYAESRGHESDFDIANAWHYRDYLIRAFNQDVPYDAFVTEHLAGDLLDHPRRNPAQQFNESILATAWPFFGEEVHSPVDIRQDECERIDNKIDVFSKTFLGLTVACARCHDHKFDAISQQDYYSLAGFMLSSHFRQVRFENLEHNREIETSLARLYQATQVNLAPMVARVLRENLAGARPYWSLARQLHDDRDGPAPCGQFDAGRLSAWATQLQMAQSDPFHPLRRLYQDVDADSAEIAGNENTQAVASAREAASDARVIVDYSRADVPWLAAGHAFGLSPRRLGDIVIPETASNPLTGVLRQGFAYRDPIWNCLKLAPDNQRDSGNLNAVGRSAGLVSTPTFVVSPNDDQLSHIYIQMQGETEIYAAVDSHLMIIGPLHQQLVVKRSAPDLEWVSLDLSEYRGHRVHLEFGPVGDSPLIVGKVIAGPPTPEAPQSHRSPPLRDDFERRMEEIEAEWRESLDRFADRQLGASSDVAAHAALIDWMVRNADLWGVAWQRVESIRALVADYHTQRAQLARQIHANSHTAIAWMDGSPVDERVMLRGKYQNLGAPAPRRLPLAFGDAGPITGSGSGRWQLAQQLTDPKNPLVARVMVNRIWHHVFGRGIVESVDNFGWLGQRPTHPELLDQLAYQFMHDDQWSVKRMIRRLVLTRTYAMSSRPEDPQVEELDPKNLLLHRMPVRRLEAEAIRDNILAISGRLDSTLYGSPVPVYLTEFVVGRGRPEVSGPLDGDGRRSIYTAVRRNFLPTMMLTFDMPIPFSTVGRRNVTNVPAQALALANDPFVYEQANVWARRLLAEQPQATSDQRIQQIVWEALARSVTPQEQRIMRDSLQSIANFHHLPEEDPRVWSDLCHTLFRVHEFIYVR